MPSTDDPFQSTASISMLRRRSQLLREIRQFFETRDFMHVETPLISRDTVIDRYIEPVQISESNVTGDDSKTETLFLQTSPEFAMKRLLASGATSIYQICKAFRQGEFGRRHNPEFTMLEWYRVGDDYQAGIELLANFARHVFGIAATQTTYRQAFIEIASVDPFESSLAGLQQVCQSHNVDTSSFAAEQERDAWLNLIMSEIVEPKLAADHPVILTHWPASQAALAKVVQDESGRELAERFELYYRGVELANGYHELLDAEELKSRNQKVNDQRRGDGNQTLPEESQLLRAMQSGSASLAAALRWVWIG